MNNKVYDRHSCLSPSFYSFFGHMNTSCRGNPTDGAVPVIPILGGSPELYSPTKPQGQLCQHAQNATA